MAAPASVAAVVRTRARCGHNETGGGARARVRACVSAAVLAAVATAAQLTRRCRRVVVADVKTTTTAATAATRAARGRIPCLLFYTTTLRRCALHARMRACLPACRLSRRRWAG
eukprot:scaffold904_cov309-Prasinococcus_capsulatus_cf.AAC.2